MATAPAMQRETVRLPATILVAVRALRLRRSGRAARDEGRQTGFIAGLRLLLLYAWRLLVLALLARLIIVVVALHEGLRILRQVRLLARAERLLPEGLAVLVAAFLELLVAALLEVLVVSSRSLRPLRLEVRILLAELLVRRCDQPEIMFGVLEIVFGRDRIAGGLGVTRKLEIFLRDVIGRSAKSSHQGRSIRKRASGGFDCAGCCAADCCARAYVYCDDAADRFSWLAVQQLLICRGSDPVATFPASIRRNAGTKNLQRIRSAQPVRASYIGDDDRFLDIPNPPRPCRGTIHPSSYAFGLHARAALNR